MTSSADQAVPEGPGMITLNVLCPSLPHRFTINDFPITSTVADLKDRISRSLRSRPPPETQRLIYRGKPLSENGKILQNILEPTDVSSHAFPCPTQDDDTDYAIFKGSCSFLTSCPAPRFSSGPDPK